MYLKKSVYIAAVCLLITGCVKAVEIPQDKQSYIGLWIGNGMTLNISGSGQVEYERVIQGSKRSIRGPIQKFEGDDFVVGALGVTTTFIVQQAPVEKQGAWHMKVDDVVLTRQPEMSQDAIPPKNTLVYMTNRAMQNFAKSIDKKDFNYFYKDISRLWQSQTTAEELRKIFQVFIDKNIKLSKVTDTKPVYSKKPEIGANNLLILEGYYPQKPLVTFKVKYIYEDPQWKLVSFACYIK